MDRQPNTNHAFSKSMSIFALVVSIFVILSFFPSVVILGILSGLLSFLLRPFVQYFEFRLGVRRYFSILVVFFLLTLCIWYVGSLFLPILLNRIQGLITTITTFPLETAIHNLAKEVSSTLPLLDESTIINNIHSTLSHMQSESRVLLEAIISFLPTLFLVPLLTYFILADGDRAVKYAIELVPNKYFEMTLNVLHKIRTDLIGYLKGWILDSFLIGLMSIIGYWSISIDFPFIIGIIAGVANLIPYVGPAIGAIPALLISVSQYGDFRVVPSIVILTIIVQLIDNTIVQPYCFAKSVNMHPVTVILILLIGNSLYGIPGMLLAIPIATILKASFLQTYWGLKHYRITE